jgi:pyruvate/2-oxoglutarate dehydrogenase complex dihydrolipoamide dehydrogenase (E3) component
MESFDVTVIGGGAGGLVAAIGFATLGVKTALVEKHALGGDCLYYGCVPSKTLLHTAKMAALLRRSQRLGVTCPDLRVDFQKVMGHMREVITNIGLHDDPSRFEAMGIKVIFGQARFVDTNVLEIGEQRLYSKKFVLATGSSPAVPPIPGLKEAGYITNIEAFSLERLPASIAILGAGPIGLEFAQVFRRLGAEVTVIDQAPTVLFREDGEPAAALDKYLQAEGIKTVLGADIDRVGRRDGHKVVSITQDGHMQEILVQEVMAALGRFANVQALGLEAVGVEYSPKGVVVDDTLRTTAPHIWACGDVTGKYQFTHVAEYQARLVVRNALLPLKAKADYRVVPWATFTDPELARVGLTEVQAQQQGLDYKVFRVDFVDIDRAITDDEAKGFTKVITSPKGKILGAHILGPNAGDLIHEFVLAMRENIPLGRISSAIHVYPTLAQVSRRTADKFYAEKLQSQTGRLLQRVVKMFN